MDMAAGKPTWYPTTASYLRRFQRDRHGPTSDLMPADRRITIACRKLYRIANEAERSVMCGIDVLPGREKARIFNRLCYKLAKLANMTAAVILPPEDEGEGKEANNDK